MGETRIILRPDLTEEGTRRTMEELQKEFASMGITGAVKEGNIIIIRTALSEARTRLSLIPRVQNVIVIED